MSPISSPYFIVLALLTMVLSACHNDNSGGGSTSRSAALPYCSDTTSYTGGVTITGSAKYEYRTNGNGPVATAKPIRFAEIRILDSNSKIIQCGETDSSGNFSLQLPKNGSNATIIITSRADNANLKAYVLNNPTNNAFHSISDSVTLISSVNIGTLTAQATGSLEGGAFHILDKILDANQYIKAETAGCTATFSECTPFTVAPLSTIYWSKGVNPGSYFGAGAISFYVPADKQIYILGGLNGNLDKSDTDHFDSCVIIHEYGHFLEDIYSSSDSPGGSHNGNSIIDPRLAWGEGWAYYFQGVVSGNPVCRDTFGNPDGIPGVYLSEDFESGTMDTPSTIGEGNFREFSVTRALWDITDASNEGAGIDEVTASFSEFWTLFTSSTIGFANPAFRFRNLGLFYKQQAALVGKTDWTSVQTGEKQKITTEDYANTFTLGGACAATTIQAVDISGTQQENGSAQNSNQFASNDFYHYTHPGGDFTLNLSYTTTGGNPADLDLYLYKDDYAFAKSSSVAGSSTDRIATGASSDTESISISGLAAGTYMINVSVYTGTRLGSSASYTMNLNTQNFCPN